MIGVLLNPNAGKGKPLKFKKKVEYFVENSGHKPIFMYTRFKGDEGEIVRKLIDKGVKTIIFMGGDGTINESLKSLIGQPVSILPLPMGSGDDYVRSLYGTNDIREILRKLNNGKTELFPVGRVKAGEEVYYFINGLGIGFDAAVLVNMKKFPFLKGSLQYLASIISTIFFYTATEISFKIDNIVDRRKILLATIGLGKFLGGGFMLLPKAHPLKRTFDISVIKEVNKLVFFRLLPLAKTGNHITSRYVKYIEGIESFVIKAKNNIKFHLDGELMPVRYKEIEVSIKNEGVRIIV